MTIALDRLSTGRMFSLVLQSPRKAPQNKYLRELPSLPYNTFADYTINSSLQVGGDFDTQVWLGKANDYRNTPLVFKFFIPSLMDPSLLQDTFAGLDRTVEDIVHCQEEVFHILWDLQGTAIPWFFGTHEVIVSGEPAYLLVMEYIPQSFDSIPLGFQFRDKDRYIKLFKSATKALDIAHSRQLYHHDIHSSNLRHDNAQVVLIDWKNDIRHFTSVEPNESFFASIDIQALFETFATINEDLGTVFVSSIENDEEIGERMRVR
ncbi:hypothetical protein VNI00_006476 [Paramarasmius palmivorus]|uniref:Protein kinase domain-containing protein n=1 Tax=Paramarasmius palmivorus TaxID=297713 RepID=A0AAW0D7U5_9AGAR